MFHPFPMSLPLSPLPLHTSLPPLLTQPSHHLSFVILPTWPHPLGHTYLVTPTLSSHLVTIHCHAISFSNTHLLPPPPPTPPPPPHHRDTAGQERFHTITTSYYRGAMVSSWLSQHMCVCMCVCVCVCVCMCVCVFVCVCAYVC